MAREGNSLAAVHYQVGKQQPIEIMQAFMSPEEFQGFCRGNVIKYALRIGHKQDDQADADKCAQYGKWMAAAMRGEKINPMEG